jgi:hypothetical protein
MLLHVVPTGCARDHRRAMQLKLLPLHALLGRL